MPAAAILFFQNEANFSLREAYPPMKTSYKFGEPSTYEKQPVEKCR